MKKLLFIIIILFQVNNISAQGQRGGCGSWYLTSDKGGNCTIYDNPDSCVTTVYAALSSTDTIELTVSEQLDHCSTQLSNFKLFKNGILLNITPIYTWNTIKCKVVGPGSYRTEFGGGNTYNTFYLTINFVSTTSVSSLTDMPEIKLFPNPNNGNFKITGLEVQNLIEITDISGRIVNETIATNSTEPLDLTYLNKGLYFYRIMDNEKKKLFAQGKFILN